MLRKWEFLIFTDTLLIIKYVLNKYRYNLFVKLSQIKYLKENNKQIVKISTNGKGFYFNLFIFNDVVVLVLFVNIYIWLSLRHWKVPDLTPILEDPWLLLDSILLVLRISWAAESKRLRMRRIAGFVVIPLRLLLL